MLKLLKRSAESRKDLSMKRITLKLTAEELKVLTALAADQLFHKEFIDPRMPGHRADCNELTVGKRVVERMRVMMGPHAV
jgi:hypothetical protein